jgi:ankyrin repeat protein
MIPIVDSQQQKKDKEQATNGNEAVVKLLLEKGAKLESKLHFGQTPLSLAAENGREAVVKLLLEKGLSWSLRTNTLVRRRYHGLQRMGARGL